VTASERPRASAKPLIDQALDLFVYAPVGLLTTSLEQLSPDDIDQLAEKGRGRIGRVLSNARVVGHLTISMGRRTIESELARWRPPAPEPVDAPGSGPARTPPPAVVRLEAAREAPRRLGPGPELAIPDYEALSASQVVRRLDGLGEEELEAIYAHESATRRRRTILHRTQQLLGREDAPGPASWPA
jgi:hypothetical protein